MSYSESNQYGTIKRMGYLNSNCIENVVYVHLLNLNDLDHFKLLNLLSEDELMRARKFHFEKDRIKFIKARGALRSVLRKYINISPERIEFNYSENGKPKLGLQDSNQLNFNLSHSGDRVIIGISNKYRVGIDIEEVNNKIDPMDIAQRFFSENEILLLENSHEDDHYKLFYRLWTRKEALLKAEGVGISIPLDKIDVSDFTGDRYISLSASGNYKELKKWYARDLIDDEDYKATIVIDSYKYNLKIIKS